MFTLPLTVDVTADDISRGYPESPTECPVALAIVRAAHASIGQVGVTGASVMVDIDLLPRDATVDEFALPESVARFIDAFDGAWNAWQSVCPLCVDVVSVCPLCVDVDLASHLCPHVATIERALPDDDAGGALGFARRSAEPFSFTLEGTL